MSSILVIFFFFSKEKNHRVTFSFSVPFIPFFYLNLLSIFRILKIIITGKHEKSHIKKNYILYILRKFNNFLRSNFIKCGEK